VFVQPTKEKNIAPPERYQPRGESAWTEPLRIKRQIPAGLHFHRMDDIRPKFPDHPRELSGAIHGITLIEEMGTEPVKPYAQLRAPPLLRPIMRGRQPFAVEQVVHGYAYHFRVNGLATKAGKNMYVPVLPHELRYPPYGVDAVKHRHN